MLSSKTLNRADTTLLGWPRKRSLNAGIIGLALLVAFYSVIQSLDLTLWLFFALCAFFGPLMVSEWLFGREEDWKFKKEENLLITLKQSSGSLACRICPEEEGLGLMSYDSNSVYTLDGFEHFGYSIENMDQKAIQALGLDLLKKLPVGFSIKFIRWNKIYRSEFLSQYRPALAQHNLISPGYYAIVSRSIRLTKSTSKHEFASSVQSLKRLTYEEMNRFNEILFNPKHRPTAADKPRFTANHYADGKFAWVFPSEGYGASSLVELPDRVDSSFPDFFGPFEGSIGYIMTRFVKEGTQGQNVTTAFRLFKILNSKAAQYVGKNSAKSEKILKNLEDRANGFGANLKMFMNCVVYGKPEEVTRTLDRLATEAQNCGAQNAATWQIDSGFIKDSLLGIAIGKNNTLVRREQKIDSLEEASFYLPPIVQCRIPEQPLPLCYRTTENVPFFIDHGNLEQTPLTLMEGPSGYGKSLLMSQMTKAHLLLGQLEQKPVAVIYGDVGSSVDWLEDNGTADLTFNLARTDEQDYEPLPIHPIHVFMEPHTAARKVSEKLPALNFLRSLIGADFEDNAAKDLIEKALDSMDRSEKTYELSKFYRYLEQTIENELSFVPQSAREKFEIAWYKRKKSLSRFCKGGIYGHIFEPKDPLYDSIAHVTVFYYNLDEDEFKFPDLIRPFINLCHATAQQLSSRFKSVNAKAHDVLYVIDEFDRQSEYLPDSNLKSMKDQSRKYGNIPVLGVQSFAYLQKGNDSSIYEGVGRTFFYTVGNHELYSRVAAIFDEPYVDGRIGTKLKAMLAISERINKEHIERSDNLRDRNAPRVVGFFDTSRRIYQLINDVEPETLWEFTTKPGGRRIRKYVRDRFNYSLEEACSFLARKLGTNIPSKTPSENEIRALIGEHS